jgi:hypothetical protein
MPLTKNRDTLMRDPALLSIPVAAGVRIFQGALVAVSAAGFAQGGATATTLTAAGRAEMEVDNTAGAAGAAAIEVRRGVFQFRNHGADAITQADLLKDAWIVDDETVARTNGGATRSRAGKIVGVETGGVWVEIL